MAVTLGLSGAFSTPLYDRDTGFVRFECYLCDSLCATEIGTDFVRRTSLTIAALEEHLQEHAVGWAREAIEATR